MPAHAFLQIFLTTGSRSEKILMMNVFVFSRHWICPCRVVSADWQLAAKKSVLLTADRLPDIRTMNVIVHPNAVIIQRSRFGISLTKRQTLFSINSHTNCGTTWNKV